MAKSTRRVSRSIEALSSYSSCVVHAPTNFNSSDETGRVREREKEKEKEREREREREREEERDREAGAVQEWFWLQVQLRLQFQLQLQLSTVSCPGTGGGSTEFQQPKLPGHWWGETSPRAQLHSSGHAFHIEKVLLCNFSFRSFVIVIDFGAHSISLPFFPELLQSLSGHSLHDHGRDVLEQRTPRHLSRWFFQGFQKLQPLHLLGSDLLVAIVQIFHQLGCLLHGILDHRILHDCSKPDHLLRGLLKSDKGSWCDVQGSGEAEGKSREIHSCRGVRCSCWKDLDGNLLT
mmetsp:Transcript_61833/g.130553  ORF Transcript_61833/g.130553 Transcript_61833/m.130553 type:complete len:291 (+) Transcript_61833:294-1166(+)